MNTTLEAKAANNINLISVSNDTVKNNTEGMSCNIKKQLISIALKSQYYLLQLDEHTAISKMLIC